MKAILFIVHVITYESDARDFAPFWEVDSTAICPIKLAAMVQ